MSFSAYVAWLRTEFEVGRISEADLLDLLLQRIRFDQDRDVVTSEFGGRAVGYIASTLLVEQTVPALLRVAAERFPGRVIYFESLGARAAA